MFAPQVTPRIGQFDPSDRPQTMLEQKIGRVISTDTKYLTPLGRRVQDNLDKAGVDSLARFRVFFKNLLQTIAIERWELLRLWESMGGNPEVATKMTMAALRESLRQAQKSGTGPAFLELNGIGNAVEDIYGDLNKLQRGGAAVRDEPGADGPAGKPSGKEKEKDNKMLWLAGAAALGFILLVKKKSATISNPKKKKSKRGKNPKKKVKAKRCAAYTKAGKKCKGAATGSSRYCSFHQGDYATRVYDPDSHLPIWKRKNPGTYKRCLDIEGKARIKRRKGRLTFVD